MASNIDDLNSDVDGWEIAQQPISDHVSECHLDQRCPDVVLKTQPINASNEKQFLRCPFCLNGYKFLKNLGCNCNACMNCAERLLSQWREGSANEESEYKKTRLCTVCDQEHTVPILVHKILKPVFNHASLKCMFCHGQKDTQDAWWCQDCSMILCSKCAHKGHRDHITVEFDQDYEAVRFCLAQLQMETQDTATKFKSMIWAKFEQIFKILEQSIDHELDSQNKQRRIRLTDIFGHCPPSQNMDSGSERLYKRLSMIQQRAKQQFPHVLDEILSLSGLGTHENFGLRTDVVAEKITQLLALIVGQLSADDFKFTIEQEIKDEENDSDKPIMYVGESEPEAVQKIEDITDDANRHY